MHKAQMLVIASLIPACSVGEIEGDHLADYTGASMSCPNLGVAAVSANGDDGHVAANAIDNDDATRWSRLGKGSWIEVDLGATKTVCSTGVAWFRGDERRNRFTIAVSADGMQYTNVATLVSSGTTASHETYDFAQVDGRYVRITVDGNTDNDWASISEIDIGGLDGGSQPPPPQPPGQYDANGVQMLLPTDPARFSWWQGNPNSDSRFRIDGNGQNAVLQPDGSYLYKPRSGNLASGGTQLTLRLHVSGTTASESFSNHTQLRQRGYMTNDPTRELGDQEMTGYFRLTNIEDAQDTISKKIRGGRHSGGSAAKYSACVGLMLRFDGKGNQLFEKELFHPTTPKFAVNKLLDYGNAIQQGRWIGDKITSVRRPDGSVVNTQYIDLDPFDANGQPKNNWVKVFEYVDSGNNVVSWSGRVSTWRIDEAKNVYAKFLSVRSVVAP